jgi:hypothetical protein
MDRAAVLHKGAFFASQKTGLSAAIPQTLPQVKSVTYGNACGISASIPFAEEAPAKPEPAHWQ